jgi:hypothetical protein
MHEAKRTRDAASMKLEGGTGRERADHERIFGANPLNATNRRDIVEPSRVISA